MIPHAEVIGDPIAQSKSPIIHRFWLDRLDIAGAYNRHLVTTADLGTYLAMRRADPAWRGCNVTMPHKLAVLPLLDRIDPLAARIGAVNTIVRAADGSLAGYNTDAAGFLEPLADDLARPHYFRMARIFGNGGAARAIVAALADKGVTLVVAGRDPAKARAMLDDLDPARDHYSIALDHFAEPTDFAFDDREGCFDLIVNASPLGMRGAAPLCFDLTHAPPGSIFYDIVTDPIETELLAAAREAGFRTIDGLSMLIGQASAAFAYFFGHPAPRDAASDQALRALLTG